MSGNDEYDNLDALAAFRYHIMVVWMRTLTRRGQKDRTGWDRINKLADQWLPKPRILTRGPTGASPSNIQGGSRMRECRTSGSVWVVFSNGHPYRDRWPYTVSAHSDRNLSPACAAATLL